MTLLLCAASVAGAVILTQPAAVEACDVAPDHQVQLLADDTPECVTVADAFNYGSGALRIDNQCEQILSIAPADCEACGDPIDIAPATEEWIDIETRTVADGLAEGTVTQPTLTWTLVDQSGTIEAEVTVYDNSDACDDWDNGTACAVTGERTGSPIWLILVGLGLSAVRCRSS